MRISILIKLLFAVSLLVGLFTGAPAQAPPAGAKALPDKVGEYRAQGAASRAAFQQFDPEDFGIVTAATRSYAGAEGEDFTVTLAKTRSTSAAYSLLTSVSGTQATSRVGTVAGVGVVGVEEPGRLRFVKGGTYVDIQGVGEQAKNAEAIRTFAGLFAGTLEGVESDIPVLVLHLPEWEKKAGEGIGYAVSLPALRQAAGGQPVLDAVSFDGGAEAVTAKYGDARLVIVEFSTPQHSVEVDARINERVAQLRAAGEPVPSAYKRVGNYSVFVFDAPDAAAAGRLISGVKYEKDVRWLGRNPHADEIATRYYTTTMGSVILTAIITTGVSILLCLGVGGLIGGAVFFYRRSKRGVNEAYSDAGGMLRLNIEDLNAPRAAPKLVGHGEE